MILTPGIPVINGFAGFYIGTHNIKCSRAAFEGCKVKRIVLQRNLTVAEIFIIDVTGCKQGIKTTVTLILTVFQVVADGAADLSGNIITAKCGTGRNTDYSIIGNSVFHHHIHDSRRKETAHGASL